MAIKEYMNAYVATIKLKNDKFCSKQRKMSLISKEKTPK
jgi:hypothetical protein